MKGEGRDWTIIFLSPCLSVFFRTVMNGNGLLLGGHRFRQYLYEICLVFSVPPNLPPKNWCLNSIE